MREKRAAQASFLFTKGKKKQKHFVLCFYFHLFFFSVVLCCAVFWVVLAAEGGKKIEYVNYIVKVYNRRTQEQRADRRTHRHIHTQKVVVLLLKVFNLLA